MDDTKKRIKVENEMTGVLRKRVRLQQTVPSTGYNEDLSRHIKEEISDLLIEEVDKDTVSAEVTTCGVVGNVETSLHSAEVSDENLLESVIIVEVNEDNVGNHIEVVEDGALDHDYDTTIVSPSNVATEQEQKDTDKKDDSGSGDNLLSEYLLFHKEPCAVSNDSSDPSSPSSPLQSNQNESASSLSGTGKSKSYPCKICGGILPNKRALRQHCRDHEYTCNTCNKIFSNEFRLHNHEECIPVKKEIPEAEPSLKGFHCELCGGTLPTKRSLQQHHRDHDRMCAICNKIFSNMHHLQRHQELMHSEEGVITEITITPA